MSSGEQVRKQEFLFLIFDQIRSQFLVDVKAIIDIIDIPAELFINWDQTGIRYVPVSSWTMEKEGSKGVEVVGVEDKRQITAVFGCTTTGNFSYSVDLSR